MVINALKSDESSQASFGHLIDSVKQSLEASTHIYFLHTLKLDNLVAHSSAKYVRGSSIWMKDVSSHLYDVPVTNK